MNFIFLHLHEENGTCYVTGCFERCKSGTEERELLDLMAECIDIANEQSFKTSKVVLKDNTIFFRAVELTNLLSTLKYWDSSLNLSLKYKIGKYAVFSGNEAKKLFYRIIDSHKIVLETQMG